MDGRRLLRPVKKLTEAAALWASGGKSDDRAREDLASFGVDAAGIELALGPKDEPFDIWPENHAAWQAFQRVQTQWASGGMGGPTGLDYTRVRAGLQMAGVEVTAEIFEGLRLIEASALGAFNKRSEANRK